MIVFKTPPCRKIIQGKRCFICGFDVHCKNIKNYNIVSQFKSLKKIVEQNKIRRIDILSSGSILDEKQIDYKQVLRLMEEIKKLKNIKSVLIEGRTEYCDLDKLRQIKGILNGDIGLEYGIGLESYSNYVRNVILKKNLALKDYEECVKKLSEISVSICSYILAGVPMLSIEDSLKETKNSILRVINFYEKHKYKGRIALFPIFITHGTLLENLYNRKKYKLITLENIAQILSEIKNKVDLKKYPIFVGLDDESISSNRNILFRNNNKEKRNLKLIQKFNRTQEI
ncbi:hypothetical protein KKF19_00905 [Patescibacteria group bacterium]|nr:hypothetical protein [Patescibacteria group bacterium]